MFVNAEGEYAAALFQLLCVEAVGGLENKKQFNRNSNLHSYYHLLLCVCVCVYVFVCELHATLVVFTLSGQTNGIATPMSLVSDSSQCHLVRDRI